MTSRMEKEAYVWIWLPGETRPVVAGRLEADDNHGRGNIRMMLTGRARPWSRRLRCLALMT
jgi:serine/threonine-protein kinase HipA